jgi:hypothetical protein
VGVQVPPSALLLSCTSIDYLLKPAIKIPNLSFREVVAIRNLKDPSLCSGHGFLPAVEMKEDRYNSKVSLRGCLWADFCGFIPDIGSCPEVGMKKDDIHYIYYPLRSIPIFSS